MRDERLESAGQDGTGSARPGRVDDRWMRFRDGTRLNRRLWYPTEERGAAPVLLMRQPYGRAIASTVTYAHPRWYASHGFLVVVQDVRGRGDSEGRFGGFRQEARDGADTVRWARQLPGADGRVGMYGFSYQGLTQLLNDGGADTVEPDPENGLLEGRGLDPLPDCLAPAMCGLDERRHWASEGGAYWWALGLGWALQLAAQELSRRGDHGSWRQIRRSLTGGTFVEDGLELLQRHDPDGMGLGWLQRPAESSDGWCIHQPPEALLRRPMLLLGGWWDPHLRGVFDLWQRSRRAGGDPDLCIGPWSHLNWSQGQPMATESWRKPGLSIDQLQLAFFRHHLGLDQAAAWSAQGPGPGSSALLFDLGSKTWQGHDPQHPRGGTWWLQSDGLATLPAAEGQLLSTDPSLVSEPAPDARSVTVVHDPWRPLPGRGGHLGLDAGPCQRDDLDARTDVACFRTAPLEQPLTLQGEAELELVVTADQPGFDLCCALSRLRPARGDQGSGAPLTTEMTTEQLCTGVLRVVGEEALTSQRRRVRFQPLLVTLGRGERLRLSVAAAAWPQVAVNPGTGGRPMGGVGPEHRVITLTLEMTGARLSMKPMVGSD
ncbi:MAG: CocE/NonD family hydrolase [Cyanobacteriota bacterium]